MKRTAAIAVLGALLLGVLVTTTRPSDQLQVRVAPAAAADAPLVVDTGPADAARDASLVIWTAGVERAQAEEAARVAAAEAARLAEEEAAAAARARAAMPAAVVPTGGCCGPHTDAWWWGVAICEQGGNNHPYFGYFSFMDGSQGGKPWAEQVAAGNALLARAGREVGPWAASCVAAGYAASPGG